jgi:hypothetical protein
LHGGGAFLQRGLLVGLQMGVILIANLELG